VVSQFFSIKMQKTLAKTQNGVYYIGIDRRWKSMADFKRSGSTAQRLSEALADKNMKQSELVRASGIDSAAISRYLSGAYEPKSVAISKLATALDVSEMWLWGYDVPKERTPEQKKNDQLAELIAMLRGNDMFYSLVVKLSQADEEQLALIDKLVSGLLK
jgi:transcriptional regulator with XRE-family HTH domain